MREPKSEWISVSLTSPGAHEALRSWFNGMVRPEDVPIKANILHRIADCRDLKLRVLIRRPDGSEREMVRTTGKSFTITSKRPTSTRWA